ncbi:Filamentation induced by cAMP protein Fic [Bosea sp. LC85]|uniref:Fic family protein n=1 Tax=Bosea sp. LC85 TaxID=1502851 RepID=UPI0004E35F93|nr:Fic family protein [Bosea sp. LC85]KFC64879.1 Filamentation induced by cAMP protein Fic [Bosea sp. LC85]
MDPMVPEEGSGALEDAVVELNGQASKLAGRIHPILQEAIGDLVRSMNCYYSNLIEGHDTHPRDIDRALANDFSSEPKKRELQKEAVAHIYVQQLIDTSRDPDAWPASAAYAAWLHEEFCSRLPPEMLFVTDRKTGERLEIEPGKWRKRDVQVGRHLPPAHGDLSRFMARFDSAYQSPPLNKFRQIQAVGAVHHRFLWIHPFLDGNGRVARLMSHALFKRLGIGTSLWSVARGLARDETLYKSLLAQADGPREGSRDGRGNLTQRGLIAFCKFFLDRSLDQIQFMSDLLEPSTLLTRMEIHVEEEIRAKRLLRGSFAVLREAVIAGEVERSKIPSLTGYGERGARNVTAALVNRGMMTASSHRAPLRLAFPSDVAERWFPNLYPANAGSRS